ncbi:hypothetical protein FOVSG1_009736 [Fusarium oxysporum f. sp. vasinfectum]
MNDNKARPLRSCLSRHDASNLGDLRYSLLVKIDEDELSIQTGLCYLWLYRVYSAEPFADMDNREFDHYQEF